MSDIECVFESMAGKGSIFISNYAAAQDISLLHSKGIKAILSVARSGLVQHSREDIPFYLYLPAQDHEEYQLYKFFNQTYDFIEQARRHCNVLVHCMAGVSRSVTIVIAYLLKKFKCSLGEVISMLQRRRSKINPNKGFIEQLKKYAQQEGLKCNFDYEEVPSLKDRSCSRGKQVHSRSKQKLPAQLALTNLARKMSHPKAEMKMMERRAQTKQEIAANLRKQRDITPPALEMVSPPKKQRIEPATIDSPQKCIQPDPSSLKRHCSSGHKASPQKKKMSIQQKITKVREKLHQKEEVRRQSQQKQPSVSKDPLDKENKGSNLKSSLEGKKSSNKHLTEYFSLYSKHHPVSLNLHDKSAQKYHPKPDQFHVELVKKEEEIRARDIRVQPRSLYSKMQQRKASGHNL